MIHGDNSQNCSNKPLYFLSDQKTTRRRQHISKPTKAAADAENSQQHHQSTCLLQWENGKALIHGLMGPGRQGARDIRGIH
jgi:hypothetical protein